MTESSPPRSPLDFRTSNGIAIPNSILAPLDFSIPVKDERLISGAATQHAYSTSSAFHVVTPKGKTDGE